jgi:hypothetical protein
VDGQRRGKRKAVGADPNQKCLKSRYGTGDIANAVQSSGSKDTDNMRLPASGVMAVGNASQSGGHLHKRKASELDLMKHGRQKPPGVHRHGGRMEVLVGTVEYAKYGIVTGSIGRSSFDLTCIIISKGWPGWAFGALAAGFTIQTVIMLDTQWLPAAQRLLPSTSFMSYSADTLNSRLLLHPVDVVFSDSDHPGNLRTWELAHRAVITFRRCRRVPKEWSSQSIQVHHERIGGVTTLCQTVFCHGRRNASNSVVGSGIAVQASAFRDLSSVMMSHAKAGLECPPPGIVLPLAPTVVRLHGDQCFHSGGWLPGVNWRATVVTPCVFTKTKWCRRRLTVDEWLGVLDMPSGTLKCLEPREKDALVSSPSVIPLKIHFAICQAMYDAVEHERPAYNGPDMLLDVTDDGSAHSATTVRHSNQTSTAQKDEALVSRESTSGLALDTLVLPLTLHKATSTKADDAEVQVHVWNARLLEGLALPVTAVFVLALDVLREFFHRLWRRGVTHSFLHWSGALSIQKRLGFVHPTRLVTLHLATPCAQARFTWAAKGLKQYRAMRKLETPAERCNRIAAVDGIGRCANSSWWAWTSGSRPLFWRWPVWYQASIRDGLPLWLRGSMKRWCVPQRVEKDPVKRAQIRTKILSPVERGYLERGEVVSLTSFFGVPKGDDDIRMVYDGTKSGFNSVLWAPWFPLPTIDQHLRVATVGCYMADIDIGEMFLNFVLHECIRVYCGVDLTSIFPEMLLASGLAVYWLRWARCGMGFTSSPYQAVQGVLVAEEVILGDHLDPSNAFRFDAVVLNLPGMPEYNPGLAWVFKVRQSDGMVASDLFIYVDDARVIGNSEDDCWLATRQTASLLNHLGLQDAARKRRAGSKEPGPWAGSICHSSGTQVEVMVSQERWDKTKGILGWLQDQLDGNEERFDFKLLESKRGYLVYISRTYPSMCPYLKGIHQTLESWRPWKREDGWSMSNKEIQAAKLVENDMEVDYENDKDPPVEVMGVKRVRSDVAALQTLISGPVPVKRKARPEFSALAIYGFGDASGKGFGSSFSINGKVIFRHGQWAQSVEMESSNYRELANLVFAVEEAAAQGHLDDCELFLFTDNTTAESAYYKGTSSVRPLFDLMLRMRKLQMEGGVIIHVVHIAGTRMIEEGTDGLSRRSLLEGVMSGSAMLSHIPLHLSAEERQANLVEWLQLWLGSLGSKEEKGFYILSPMEWYTTGQTRNRCIWMPPPAAADVAAELLGKSKHKRAQNEHVFVCPRLMTNRWRKHLSKICDVAFTTPVGTHSWNVEQHEPLLVGLCFPLSRHRPWRLRGTKLMERVVSQLSELSTTAPFWGRDILRELFLTTRGLDSLPESMVRTLL